MNEIMSNNNANNNTLRHFAFDVEKLLDMKELTKTEFLASYSYLTEEEYDKTQQWVDGVGGFNSYGFSKRIFDILTGNETVFRMAVSDLMTKGINHYEGISYDELRDGAKENGLMTREFVVDLLVTAKHLSRCDHLHLLNYISKNIAYHVGDEAPSYRRLENLFENALEYATEDCDDCRFVLGYCIGLEADEAYALNLIHCGDILSDEEEF